MKTRILPPGIYQPSPGRFSARVKSDGVEYNGGTHGSLEGAIAARDAMREKAGAKVVVAVTRTSGVKFLGVDTFDAAGPRCPELTHHGFGRVKSRNELSRARAW